MSWLATAVLRIVEATVLIGGLALFLWVIVKVLTLTGLVETRKQTLERKMREADHEAIEISRYRKLSEEGKLLYELNKKQDQTEANTRAIYGMILGGAVGYLVIYFWPF